MNPYKQESCKWDGRNYSVEISYKDKKDLTITLQGVLGHVVVDKLNEAYQRGKDDNYS